MDQNLYIELKGISNADITDEEAQTLVEGIHKHISEDTDAAPEHVNLKYDDWAKVAQFVGSSDHRVIAELVGHAQAELQSGDLDGLEDTLSSLARRSLRFVPDTDALDPTPTVDADSDNWDHVDTVQVDDNENTDESATNE